MISLVLAFTSIIILIQKYLITKQQNILFFQIAVILMFLRTLIFALVRYGTVSSFFIFPVRFGTHYSGGLVYVSLVYFSHFFLLLGMISLAKRKIRFLNLSFVIIPSLYSIVFFALLNLGIRLPSNFGILICTTGFAIIPVLVVKVVILYNGIYLSILTAKSQNDSSRVLLIFFFLFISFGQMFDGLFYAFADFRFVTLVLSIILPYTAFLIFLPKAIDTIYKNEMVSLFDDKKIEIFSEQYDLTEQDKELVSAILRGSSNKEIAYNLKTTLSIIKHRIFSLYKKCSINSRWELINLIVK
jgi:DNA-binding CsgD family transcriptional regulator